MKMTGIILAGGKNRRLGRVKALESVGNQRLIERVQLRLQPLCHRTLIVTSPEQTDLPVSGDAEILTDLYPGRGPLGGIYTGLKAAETRYSLVVACDMPFLNPELLKYMTGLTGNYDLVLPRLGELIEPLHAIYSRACLAHIELLIKEDRFRIFELLKMVRVRYVAAEEIDRFDPEHLSFFNINSEADLARAREIAGTEAQT